MRNKRPYIERPLTNGLIFAICLFELLAFSLLSLKGGNGIDRLALICGALGCFAILLQYVLFRFAFKGTDLQVLIIVSVLSAVGLIMQYRLDPSTAFRQFRWYAIAIACMFVAMIAITRIRAWSKLATAYAVTALVLLALAAFFGDKAGGSRNWFSFGKVSFQPSEFAKLLLVFTLACELSKNKSIRKLVPVGLFVGMCMLLLVFQKDLGAALLYFGTAIVMLYVGTGNAPVTLLAVGAGSLGAFVSYKLFDHVRVRVAIWLDPWVDALGDGYQIVQSLIAIASGGLFGAGLGNGSADTLIPAVETDFIYALVCEEFGQIFGVALMLFYVVLIFRGCIIALRAKNRFDSMLALGCVSMIALQTFLIIGGVIKLIPLTGVTLPFVSYGGSSMVTNMALIGVLQGVSIRNGGRAA